MKEDSLWWPVVEKLKKEDATLLLQTEAIQTVIYKFFLLLIYHIYTETHLNLANYSFMRVIYTSTGITHVACVQFTLAH